MTRKLIDLPTRTVQDTTGDVQKLLGRLEESGNALRVVRLLANSENAFKPFVLMSTALMAKATLPAPDREVVILHLAARRGTTYEWEEHVPMSATAGISDEQREVLLTGAPPDGEFFTEAQVLAARIARVIVEEHHLPAEDWTAACGRWGSAGAMDLILTVAWWGAFIPTVIETFGLETPYG